MSHGKGLVAWLDCEIPEVKILIARSNLKMFEARTSRKVQASWNIQSTLQDKWELLALNYQLCVGVQS